MDNKNFKNALTALSAKTKSVEDKIATARAEAKEKLDTTIAESKAEAAAKREKFIAKAESLKASADYKSIALKASIGQKIAHLKAEAEAKKEAVKNKVEEKKHDFDVHRAEKAYHDACTYGDHTIEYAIVALAEVETAVLEAFAAKLKLDDLKKVNV
jgi:phage-related minor tail protein